MVMMNWERFDKRIYLCPFSDGNTSGYNPFLQWRCKTYNRRLRSLEDLKKMEEEGVEILTCGTCLKHYGLMEKLMVGKVTDMYTIAERMTGADKVIRP